MRDTLDESKFDEPDKTSVPNGEPDEFEPGRKYLMDWLNVLWDQRGLLFRALAVGLIVATLIAFLIPKRYTAVTQLMPPDSQSTSSMMMLAGLAEKAGSGLGAMAGDLLGVKSSGALFVGYAAESNNRKQFDPTVRFDQSVRDKARARCSQEVE